MARSALLLMLLFLNLVFTAQAFALTFIIPELSLRLTVDGATVDLTGAGSR